MPVLTVFGESYTCARAQKGNDFVRLLDENNTIIFFADEITDFSPYVLSEGSWETPIAVIAPTVAAISSLNGTVIMLDIPATVKVETDLVVNFKAPCDCSAVTSLSINGNNYTLVNALGENVAGTTQRVWGAGAQLSVILDVEAKNAYLQNGAAATPATLQYVWNNTLRKEGGEMTGRVTFKGITLTKNVDYFDSIPTDLSSIPDGGLIFVKV